MNLVLVILAVVIVVAFLVWKIIRENKRKPIWIGDPEKELTLHNTAAREKLWGDTSDWKLTEKKQPRQENEKN